MRGRNTVNEKIKHSNHIPSAVYNFGQVTLYSSKAGHLPSGFE